MKTAQTLFASYLIFNVMILVYGNPLHNNITILDMDAEQLTCIDFDTLNQLKNLEEMKFDIGNMQYFPDQDCNNTVYEEDIRALDMPILKSLSLSNIRLLKAPDVSLMPKLEEFLLPKNAIREIPGTPFRNNRNLKKLHFFDNYLTTIPNITGACNNLDTLSFDFNRLTAVPEDYFVGCNIRSITIRVNRLIAFPNFDPLGDSVKEIIIDINHITGMFTTDMVKHLPKLNVLHIMFNLLQGVDASFCHGNQRIYFNANPNPNLGIFENPYRFCTHLLDKFDTKPQVILTSTNIPCDHHRCWMKKYASKFTITIDNCPDGRAWAAVTETDVCGQG